MQIIHYISTDGVDIYQKWINSLKDMQARLSIFRRIDRALAGNLGDHKACREGISELRIDAGAGYRVYYFLHGNELVILLCGGSKKTQDKDIEKALFYKNDFLRRIKEKSYD